TDPAVHGRWRALGGVPPARAAGALDRGRVAVGGGHRAGLDAVWPSISHFLLWVWPAAGAGPDAVGVGGAVRSGRVRRGGGQRHTDPDRVGAPVVAPAAPGNDSG